MPPTFDHARADPAVRQTTAQWESEGVRSIDGAPLPDLAGASIATPAGARGPAFLVGNNFRTILRYNNSVNYALGVALLARQIDGGGPVATPWPRDIEPLSRAQLQTLQEALNRKGFAAGTPDGVMGPATRAGLRGWRGPSRRRGCLRQSLCGSGLLAAFATVHATAARCRGATAWPPGRRRRSGARAGPRPARS